MLLGGYQKLTLIDYPGKIATTVFTVGCSFRCPFCHNPELVLATHNSQPITPEKEFFDFLKKRQGKLEGVCITGGEPTIQPDIIDFIKKIKELGFLVKLDTNGTRPEVIKELFKLGIIDYVAMDIKHAKKKYALACGKKTDIKKIEKSVKMIMQSGVDYEFRTTVVPGIHTEKDFLDIAKWIRGAEKYYLQEYRDIKILDKKLRKLNKGKSVDLQRIQREIAPFVKKVGIRS